MNIVYSVLAVILSPILALCLSIWWNNKQEAKKRKIDIFRILMSTRAEGLSRLHVEALNKIDIEFYGDENVIGSWKLYLNHLYSYNHYEPKNAVTDKNWQDKKIDLLVDLLFFMAHSLGYKFNKADIKRDIYRPEAYKDIESDQLIIRKGLVDIFQKKEFFPIFAVVSPAQNDPAKTDDIPPISS